MRRAARGTLALIATLGLSGVALASDVSVIVNVPAQSSGSTVAAAFENAWSQSGEFSCAAVNDLLIVFDLSGDCDEPISRYQFDGDLQEAHTLTLRIQCSPTSPSFEMDSGGLTPLSLGANVFSSLGDTLTVTLSFPPPGGAVPTLPEWGLIALAALVLGAGAVVLRRARPTAAA